MSAILEYVSSWIFRNLDSAAPSPVFDPTAVETF